MGLKKHQIDQVAARFEKNSFSCLGMLLPEIPGVLPSSEFRFVSKLASSVYHISPLIHGNPLGSACGTLTIGKNDNVEIHFSPIAGKTFCRACAATSKVAGVYSGK